MVDASDTAAQSALAGIKVLDLSRVLAGPWSAQTLGDLGASVVKVEHPGRGDDTRAWGPPFLERPDETPGAPRESAYYLCCNRNKKSVAIDMARPEGAALIRRLAAESDILIENFKVGGLKKYGLDYEAIRAINPALIYCSITGFGQDGPYAGRGGYDFVLQGMGGLMSLTGQPDGTPGAEPLRAGVAVTDLFTGMYATVAILAALRHRDLSGQGQHIDCALLEAQIAMLANHATSYLVSGVVPGRLGNAHPTVVPYRTFATRDKPIIVAVGNDGQFRALCRLVGRPELGTDARFSTAAGRIVNRVELEATLADIIANFSSEEIIAAMIAAGIPGGPINNLEQVFSDPQVEFRGVVRHLEADDGVQVPTVGFPPRLSETPATYRQAPPRVGEHTLEVLREALALGEPEIAGLLAGGIVAARSAPAADEAGRSAAG